MKKVYPILLTPFKKGGYFYSFLTLISIRKEKIEQEILLKQVIDTHHVVFFV